MTLDEVQRRNRWRIAVLAVLSFLNLWAVATGLVMLLVTVLSAAPWESEAALAGGAAAVSMALYLWWRVRTASDAALRELGAVELHPDEWPRTGHLIEEVAIATGTPIARVAVLEDPAPNALTVGAGPSSAVLVLTRGLVTELTRDEQQAVIASQLCAVARLDVALRTFVVACSHGTLALPRLLKEMLAEVWYPTLLRWATSPSRLVADWLRRRAFAESDFGADDMAVAITRHPDALRSALVKLLEHPGVVAAVTPENAPLWFEPMPVADADRTGHLARRAMTPSLEARIARLPRSP